jgi:pimeloyl-ACP methyl ester carboxylesterase
VNLDWDLVEQAAVASIHAYLHASDPGTESRKVFSNAMAFAAMTITPALITVAFKGSTHALHWVNNARVLIPKRYGGALTHRGFAAAHSGIWHEIRQELETHSGTPILLTGHSLGGAMAELSALMLQDMANTRKIHMVTFGKPNVFLKPRANRLENLQTQLSVVHGSDAVARRPRIMYGPDQGQRMLYLSNSGHTILFPDMHARMGDYSAAQYLAADGRIRDAASDHYMATYLDRIKQARFSYVLVAGGGLARVA